MGKITLETYLLQVDVREGVGFLWLGFFGRCIFAGFFYIFAVYHIFVRVQHHVWLAANAKKLLVLVPGHPWVNLVVATVGMRPYSIYRLLFLTGG